jgi:hypothetical protein
LKGRTAAPDIMIFLLKGLISALVFSAPGLLYNNRLLFFNKIIDNILGDIG